MEDNEEFFSCDCCFNKLQAIKFGCMLTADITLYAGLAYLAYKLWKR